MVALWSFSQWTKGLPPLRVKQISHQTGAPPIQLSKDTRTKPFLKRSCPTMLFRVNTTNWLFYLIKWDPAPKAAWTNRAHKDQRENRVKPASSCLQGGKGEPGGSSERDETACKEDPRTERSYSYLTASQEGSLSFPPFLILLLILLSVNNMKKEKDLNSSSYQNKMVRKR